MYIHVPGKASHLSNTCVYIIIYVVALLCQSVCTVCGCLLVVRLSDL